MSHGYGLTPREEAAVVRLEAGESKESVAAALGMTRQTVEYYASHFVVTENILTKFERTTRRSDARYRAALAASGGCYR
ncbi:MAG: hypothetical protein ACK4TC_09465 [Sphingomonas pseudosanguinis]|uniref:hypothetical protein n=1 Tax=Sphingomonas pseudosanguinis TaxID=413712 RepID=UPI00391B617D